VAVATRNETDNELRERPIGEVAKELTSDLSLLMRQEIELAKAEMAEKGRTAAPGLGMFGGAGIVALCAAGAITAFLVLVFSLFLPEWAAALIVGAALAAVAYVLIKQGKERVAEAGKPVPEQTIETVKEDVEWAKTRASSARK
jgi:VIT1/CCC1 family predicted Fe2+/Mn2+ transporter